MTELPSGTVTLLFTDIEGSTRLLQQLGDLYAEILAQHRRLLRTAIAEWDGHEVDTQGDSFLFAFARASAGVAAAVAAQRALVAHRWPEGVTLRVRMGLHTGDPLRIPEGYVGIDVHRAARICTAGYGGEILCSRATADRIRRRLAPGVQLRDLGTHRLKDLNQPEHIFQIVATGLPAEFPPLRTLDQPLQHLPDEPALLVGREAEINVAVDILRRPETTLLTLTGPRGVGKTRLAVEIGATLGGVYADGVYFVTLPSGADPQTSAVAIATALKVEETPQQSLIAQLRRHLHDRHLLLILDDLEESDGPEEVLPDLLITCPRLSAIVTARSTLGIRGEHELPVLPLALPSTGCEAAGDVARSPAVELFVQRARLARPDVTVTEGNAALVADLSVRLEGLPLAIELAAARVPHLPLRTLLARLDRRLSLLPPQSERAGLRPQTLRETIAWSYHLLGFEEQALFRRLAVFTGHFTPAAVAAVAEAPDGAGNDLAGRLTALVEAGLLRSRRSAEGHRFVMHDAVRDFALERLQRSGEAEEAQRRHATYLIVLAQTAEPSGVAETGGPSWLDTEWHNVESAFRWAQSNDAALAVALAVALAPHWQARGMPSQARIWLEAALAGDETGGDPASRADALTVLGAIAQEQADVSVARTRLEQALTLWQSLDNAPGHARVLSALAHVAALQHDFELARAQAEESRARALATGDVQTVAGALAVLGSAAFATGDIAGARARFREILSLERELEDTRARALPLAYLGVLALLEGDRTAGRALVEESLALLYEVDDRRTAAMALSYLVRLAWPDGDERLLRRLEEWLTLCRELRDDAAAARALMILGNVVERDGDLERAEAAYEESLLLCLHRPQDTLTIAGSLAGLAEISATQDSSDRTARLFGAARAALERVNAHESPADQIDRSRIGAIVRAGQLVHGREAEWAAGRSMTPRQALAYVLR